MWTTIIVVLACIYLYKKLVLDRGLLFVRSANYLMLLGDGMRPHEANMICRNRISYKVDDERPILAAKFFSLEHFDGKQLPVIAEAKKKGFLK